MGAFLLYPENSIDPSKALSQFSEKGFKDFHSFSLGKYRLIIYSKILINVKNDFRFGEDLVFTTGTFCYKGHLPEDSVSIFYDDFKDNSVDHNQIAGSFCIIMYINKKLYLSNDDENLYPVYICESKEILSSSFLALCELSENLTINKLSIKETLITGCSFGFDTYFNEIKRYRWGEKQIIPKDIEYFSIKKNKEILSNDTKSVVCELQKNNISSVFQRVKPIADTYGCEMGLSSGYDSRLLYSISLKIFGNKKIHLGSNYKNPPDNDLLTARKIAEISKVNLNEVPITPTKTMTREQLLSNINKAFLFYDGQIRVNHGWTREYRTFDYRKKVLDGTGFAISGHAGELFRNDFNLDNYIFAYRQWINNSILGKAGRNKIRDKKELKELSTYVKNKFEHIIIGNNSMINRESAHRYYNEAWVQSGPGIRIGIDNQLTYFISPFTDYNISKNTYYLSKYLNSGADFEKHLVEYFNHDLASIPYESKNREFLPALINTTLIYRLGIDLRSFIRIYFKKKNQKFYNYFKNLQKDLDFLKNPILLKTINLEIFINNCADESEIDRIISFAYICQYYSGKIQQ